MREMLQSKRAAFEHQPKGVDMEPIHLRTFDGITPPHASGTPRPLAHPDKRGALQEQLAKLLDAGIIRRSAETNTTFAGQVVMATKGAGYRLCVDFKQLNAVLVPDANILPTVPECLATLTACQRFFALDLKAGFHQIPIAEADKYKTRFVCEFGTFEYNFLPFGVATGPVVCQRMMEDVFTDLIAGGIAAIYLDDIGGGDLDSALGLDGTPIVNLPPLVQRPGVDPVWARTIRNLSVVLDRAIERRVVFGWEKSQLGNPFSKWLGQLLTPGARQIDPSRFDGLRRMGCPRNKKELVAAVALFSYYRDYIPNLAEMLQPFSALTAHQAKFNWTEVHTKAFNAIIEAICTSTSLVALDWNHPFTLITDASNEAIGATLLTGPPGQQRPWCFASRRLNPAERNYNVTEKECLAIHWSVDRWREILWARPFFVHTDHKNLVFLQSSANARVKRWRSSLSRYDFQLQLSKICESLKSRPRECRY